MYYIDFNFCTSVFLQEEEFTGFGSRRGRPPKASSLHSKAKSPQTSDHSSEAKPLLGKIIPKTTKPPLIGKIVPRVHKDKQDDSDSPVEIPRVVIKLHGKQQTSDLKDTNEDEEALGQQSSTRSTDFIKKAEDSADSGSTQSQTAATSVVGTKQEKQASAVLAVKGAGRASKVKERGEVSEDCEQSQPQRSVKRIRGFRLGNTSHTSEAVALSFTSFHKQQKKRQAKGTMASPEAGAEAGAQSGEEAAMPLECKVEESSSQKRTHRRIRKSVFGHKRKTGKNPHIKGPKLRRNRTKRVFYTYVVEPIPAEPMQHGNEQQLQGQNVTQSAGEQSPFSEQVRQNSNNSSITTMSGRSSRVIKVPKRFLDEEIIPFPKRPLPTWLKSQMREDGKPGPSYHESSYDENLLQSDSDSIFVGESQSAVKKLPAKPSPGTGHLEIYKNLKKLTLKLAEKKKGQPDIEGDPSGDGDSSTIHVKRRRRSKLTMEEMDSPGVVRKLAIVVNADADLPSHEPLGDTSNKSKNCFFVLCNNLIKLFLFSAFNSFSCGVGISSKLLLKMSLLE